VPGRKLAPVLGVFGTLIPAIVLGGSVIQEVELVVHVRVPDDTPVDARVYLAGSHPAVGEWRPDGAPLVRQADGRHVLRLRLPRGIRLDYKYTLGTWERVEKGLGGIERPNRVFEARSGEDRTDEVLCWAAKSPRKSSLTGNIRRIENVRAARLPYARDVWVYLPPQYEREPERRFPVVYLQDGQNVFDVSTSAFGSEWRADDLAERLIRQGTISPVILVAVANSPDRLDEYTGSRDARFERGGKGQDYAHFLIEELKPRIDRDYRTLSESRNTAIVGSSLGGLISLEIARLYPDRVGAVAALSPALGWDEERLLRELSERPESLGGIPIWIDMGTFEGSESEREARSNPHVERVVRLGRALLQNRQDRSTLEVRVIEDGRHDEASWSARFGEVLIFLDRNRKSGEGPETPRLREPG
jgi:predicted alpha/beta superfamily hydrolase